MSPEVGRDADGPQSCGSAAPGWALWRRPARLRWPVLLVEATAAVLVAVGLAAGPLPTTAQLGVAAVVWLLAAIQTEASVRVEQERRRLGGEAGPGAGTHLGADLSAVWTFAGTLVLPGAHAAILAAVVVFHLWARALRPAVPLRRQAYRVATVALACFLTSEVVDAVGPGPAPVHQELWVLVIAMLVFTAVIRGLTAVVAVRLPRARLSTVLAPWDEHVLELGVLCLGALTAIVLIASPWMVLFVVPPLLVLLRAVLIGPLVAAASVDGKTGLLNAATWQAEADRVLQESGAVPRACGVLVVDLDHFKAVNDTHGHVVGDRVLAAVADVLRGGVRGHDVVGRLGGEEFVVLPLATTYGMRSVELEVVAERIRSRVAALQVEVATPGRLLVISGLTVSVGGAVSPLSGTELATLLQTADAALYAAKRAGRNRVRIEMAPPSPSRVGRPGGEAPRAGGLRRCPGSDADTSDG
jgi:diguanylate cyclase (GGDEF)-like protein